MISIGLPVRLATGRYFLYMSDSADHRISYGVQEHYNGLSASTTWSFLIYWGEFQQEILS